MFAMDLVCLSTYSNVISDYCAKAWRPNSALFSYNCNGVQSDKTPNSFYCLPSCCSVCLYCPSTPLSLFVCGSASLSVCYTPPILSVYHHQCLPACLSHWLHVCWHTWASGLKFMSHAFPLICNLCHMSTAFSHIMFSVCLHCPDINHHENVTLKNWHQWFNDNFT